MLLEIVFLLLAILLLLNIALVYLLVVKGQGREEAHEAMKVDKGKP